MTSEKLSNGLIDSVVVIMVSLFLTNCCITQNSTEEQRILSELIDTLNHSSDNYRTRWYINREYHSWSGDSGATDIYEERIVFMEIKNNTIFDYREYINKSGWPIDELPTYCYFSNEEILCEKELTTSKCNEKVIELEPEAWLKPGKILWGCRLIYPGSTPMCKCQNGNKLLKYQINGFPCMQEFKREYNMRIVYSNVYSYTNHYIAHNASSCFFEVEDKEKNEWWAIPCYNKLPNVVYTPDIPNDMTPLKNVECHAVIFYYGSNIPVNKICSCSFDPIVIRYKTNITPQSYDLLLKAEIVQLLNIFRYTPKDVSKKSDAIYGSCYYFYDKGLNQTFCFDNQSLITYAQFGWNYTKSQSTSIDIYTIRKI